MSKTILTSAFTALNNELKRMATRWFASDDDVEDALQDTFLRLWPYADNLKSDNQVKAMAVTTLRHLGVDNFRKQTSRPRSVSLDDSPQLDGAVASETPQDDERLQMVENLMQRILTPVQYDILRMKEYEGLDYQTIADKLGMNQPAVRMQLSRARKSIREAWNSSREM